MFLNWIEFLERKTIGNNDAELEEWSSIFFRNAFNPCVLGKTRSKFKYFYPILFDWSWQQDNWKSKLVRFFWIEFSEGQLEITIRNLKSEVTLLEEVWSMRLGRIGKMRSKFKHFYAIYIWILWYKIIRSRNSFHVLQLNFAKRKTIKNARRRMKRDVIVLLIFLDSLMGDSEEPESIDSVIFKNP